MTQIKRIHITDKVGRTQIERWAEKKGILLKVLRVKDCAELQDRSSLYGTSFPRCWAVSVGGKQPKRIFETLQDVRDTLVELLGP